MWAISYQTYASKWLIIPAVIACDSPIDLQYLGRDDAQRPFPTIIMTWGKPVIFFKSISIIFVLMRIRPADTSQVFRNISPTHSHGHFFFGTKLLSLKLPNIAGQFGAAGKQQVLPPHSLPCQPQNSHFVSSSAHGTKHKEGTSDQNVYSSLQRMKHRHEAPGGEVSEQSHVKRTAFALEIHRPESQLGSIQEDDRDYQSWVVSVTQNWLAAT